MNFKEKFPTEQSVSTAVRNGWGNLTEILSCQVEDIQQRYILAKKRLRWGKLMVSFITGILFLSLLVPVISLIPSSFASELLLVTIRLSVVFIVPVLIVLALYFLIRSNDKTIVTFNQKVNIVLFPAILDMLGIVGKHMSVSGTGKVRLKLPKDIKEREAQKSIWFRNFALEGFMVDSPLRAQVLELLKHSELVTEPANTAVVEDILSIPWGGTGTLFVSELDLKHITSNGKRTHKKEIFSGYFVALDIDNALKGKTFVSTEDDKTGFGHRSFWGNIIGSDIQETVLEWNDFEEMLHVATNNPSEARYILTPDFMASVYDWWNGKKNNIRISFVGSKMYMLFPDEQIQVKNTVEEVTTDALQVYADSIAIPLVHVLHLAEDIVPTTNIST